MELHRSSLGCSLTESLVALTQCLGPFGIVEGLLPKDGRSLALSQRGVVASRQSAVGDHSIVPEGHTAGLPLPSDRQVVSGVKMLTQEVEGVDALLCLELGNVNDEHGVVEERLEFRDRVSANLFYSNKTAAPLQRQRNVPGDARVSGDRGMDCNHR